MVCEHPKICDHWESAGICKEWGKQYVRIQLDEWVTNWKSMLKVRGSVEWHQIGGRFLMIFFKAHPSASSCTILYGQQRWKVTDWIYNWYKSANLVPSSFSNLILSCCLPLLISFQPHWPPFYSSNTPSTHLPQGLWTCSCAARTLSLLHLHDSVISFKSLLKGHCIKLVFLDLLN